MSDRKTSGLCSQELTSAHIIVITCLFILDFPICSPFQGPMNETDDFVFTLFNYIANLN